MTTTRRRFCLFFVCGLLVIASLDSAVAEQSRQRAIQLSKDGSSFVYADTAERFRPWGVNYDHEADSGALIEDYWIDRWQVVKDDFQEIKALGANTVRVHLQLGRFMKTATKADSENLAQLKKLLKLAEALDLYLDLTGLGCYHKQDVPEWYDALSEAERWAVQARFWKAISATCKESSAVFCYDLMNEPILPGKRQDSRRIERSGRRLDQFLLGQDCAAIRRDGQTGRRRCRRRRANQRLAGTISKSFSTNEIMDRADRRYSRSHSQAWQPLLPEAQLSGAPKWSASTLRARRSSIGRAPRE